MTKKTKTHTFNGVRYKLFIDDKLDGFCDDPKTKGTNSKYPGIWLPNGLPNTKKALTSLIHEALHAENYNTKEKTVERVSTEIASLLWRLNYRRKA